MKANQAAYPVATMCRLLGVSTSGFYAWLERGPSARAQADAQLLTRIAQIHQRSRETYGKPRVHAELTEQGIRVGGKRVARLMRSAGLHGVSRRKRIYTTVRDPDARPAPDLVQRHFSAQPPDALWVADITYIATWAGFLYLAVVIDAFSRRVVGWAMQNHLRSALVLQALEMAYGQRRPGRGRAGSVTGPAEPRAARSGHARASSASSARRPQPRWRRSAAGGLVEKPRTALLGFYPEPLPRHDHHPSRHPRAEGAPPAIVSW